MDEYLPASLSEELHTLQTSHRTKPLELNVSVARVRTALRLSASCIYLRFSVIADYVVSVGVQQENMTRLSLRQNRLREWVVFVFGVEKIILRVDAKFSASLVYEEVKGSVCIDFCAGKATTTRHVSYNCLK